jgi:hypothetical protein
MITNTHRIALLWITLVCALCSACATTQKADWLSDKVHANSDRVLFEVTRVALDKNNFQVGAGLDEAHLSVVSGWNISLAPFRGKGFREQCEIKYTRTAPGDYSVVLRVRREKNDDLVHPLDLTYAEWVSEPDDQDRARIVLQYIKSLLGSDYRPGNKIKEPVK